MLFWTKRERLTLAVLGLSALIALGIIALQKHATPIVLSYSGSPSSYKDFDLKLKEAKQVNINTATQEELERLPEVGPSLAREIIKYRTEHGTFDSASDLEKVPGIGPKTFDLLKEYIKVN
jgi:comEA protein